MHHVVTFHRIITSASLTEYVVNGSATVVRFDLQFDLTQEQVINSLCLKGRQLLRLFQLFTR